MFKYVVGNMSPYIRNLVIIVMNFRHPDIVIQTINFFLVKKALFFEEIDLFFLTKHRNNHLFKING